MFAIPLILADYAGGVIDSTALVSVAIVVMDLRIVHESYAIKRRGD